MSSLGVVWQQDDCADATLKAIKGEELSSKEKRLVDKKCYENFRNKPNIKIFDVQEKKKKTVTSEEKKMDL